MYDITTLGVALDTSDLKQGESALNSAAAAANKAADAMDAAGGSASRMASSYSGIGESTQRIMSSMDPYLTALQQEYDLLGLSRAESEAYITRARGMSDMDQQLASALGGKIDAWNREEDAARRAAVAEEAMIASGQRFLASLQQQAETLGMSGAELAAYQGQLKGLTESQIQQAAALGAKIEAWKADAAATSAAAAAESQATQAKQQYLQSLQREADLLGKSSAEKEAYIAKEKGLSDAERQVAVSLRAQVDAFNQAAAAERAEAAEKDKATRAADTFIANLQRQADSIGKTRAELLQMQAAQHGVSDKAAPLIAQIEAAGQSTHGFGLKTAAARREVIVLAHEMAMGNWSRFGGSMMVLGEQMDVLSKLMSPLGLAIGGVTAALAISAVTSIHAAESMAQYGDTVMHLHQQTGLSTDDIQKFSYAMTVVSGNSKDAGTALDSLAKNIGRAQQGSRRILGDFDVLGISMKDLKSLSFDQVLGKIADRFSQTADDAGKFTVAQQLFGGAAKDMIPLLDRGSEGLAALGVQAEKVGAVLGEHTVEKMYELSEQMNTVHANMNAVSTQAKTALLPALLDISGAFVDVSTSGVAVNEFFNGVGIVLKGTAAAAATVAVGFDQLAEGIATAAVTADFVARGEFRLAGNAIVNGWQHVKDEGEKYKRFLNDLYKGIDVPDHVGAPSPAKPKGHITPQKFGSSRGNRENDNSVNADLADLQNQQRMIEDALRTSLEHIKSLRKQGVIDQQEALTESYDAEQEALRRRIDIDQQQLEVAKGKKNAEAYRKYADDIARLQAQMANNTKKYADDMNTANAEQTAAIESFSKGLEAQLKAQQTAADTKLAGLSMGGVDKADYDTQIKLLEDYTKRQEAVRKSWREHPDQKGDLDDQLDQLSAFYAREVAIAQTSSAEMKVANADWTTGAKRAIADYGDQAANVASATEHAFGGAFKGMEDAFATFVTTGKLSFSGLATSILSDIARIEARTAISGLFKYGEDALPGLFSSAMAAVTGTRASGGTVDGDGTYLVGENGPELFRPGTSGTIIPNNAISSGSSGGGNSTITVSVPVAVQGNASPTDQQHAGDLGMKIRQAVQAVLQNELRQGGVLWKMNNRVS
ncbi:phage tail tape measure C-terminal domain-containing protein [Burkholderia ubonensis]|uniref:phage tail tape measure C-terminal domain-containing protein n=1 Tax=Burkholderia ubonensis TaxID=101571 RepID=UPI0007537514|nr:phage tail tape measure C-terminal domain-containing protein [Burkholderia ubonensis]KWC51565.1 hypothetical protein WL53_02070 [Burkholderia ubonensis]